MKLLVSLYSKLKFIIIRLFCFITFLWIVITKKKNQKIYICAYPLGDTCYALSFRSHLLKNKCKFYFSEGCKTLIDCCYLDVVKNADVVYYRKEGLLYKAISYSLSCIWQNSFFSKLGVKIVFPYAYLKGHIPFDYFSILRKVVFPFLPNSANVEFAIVPKVQINSINDFEAIKHRVVIINPFSVSMPTDGNYLWEKITMDLLNRGYFVYTNVLNNQKEIKNTKRLECSIIELFNICNEIPLFISVRSGIVDFTISSKCEKIVIWYNINNIDVQSIRNICNISAWNVSNVHSITHYSIDDTLMKVNELINMCDFDINS